MTKTEGYAEFVPEFCVSAPELTPRRVELVQKSFALIKSGEATGLNGKGTAQFAEYFYGGLFEDAPGVRPLFPEDMTAQKAKLVMMLVKMVSLLNSDVPSVVKILDKLARVHHKYGTRPEHYGPVGQALVGALTQSLGDAMDEETAAAWVRTNVEGFRGFTYVWVFFG